MDSRQRQKSEPWLVHFFQRGRSDDPSEAVPVLEFLDLLPPGVVAKMRAVLEAVAEGPPPSFSGGGMWEAMRGEMAGFYEVRVQGAGANHRLLCVLDRAADDLGGPSIICVYGFSKPKREAASRKDYQRARAYRSEFERYRRVFS